MDDGIVTALALEADFSLSLFSITKANKLSNDENHNALTSSNSGYKKSVADDILIGGLAGGFFGLAIQLLTSKGQNYFDPRACLTKWRTAD